MRCLLSDARSGIFDDPSDLILKCIFGSDVLFGVDAQLVRPASLLAGHSFSALFSLDQPLGVCCESFVSRQMPSQSLANLSDYVELLQCLSADTVCKGDLVPYGFLWNSVDFFLVENDLQHFFVGIFDPGVEGESIGYGRIHQKDQFWKLDKVPLALAQH